MKNFWLTYMYKDEKENSYKPLGWDLVEDRGNATVRHHLKDYHSSTRAVILETDVSEEIEQELRTLGLKELTRNKDDLKTKRKSVTDKISLKERKALDDLDI